MTDISSDKCLSKSCFFLFMKYEILLLHSLIFINLLMTYS